TRLALTWFTTFRSNISIINNLFIDFRQVRYWNSIWSQGRGRRTRKAPRPGWTCPRTSSAGWTTSPESVGLAAKREGTDAATRPALRHCLARIGRGVLQGARCGEARRAAGGRRLGVGAAAVPARPEMDPHVPVLPRFAPAAGARRHRSAPAGP